MQISVTESDEASFQNKGQHKDEESIISVNQLFCDWRTWSLAVFLSFIAPTLCWSVVAMVTWWCVWCVLMDSFVSCQPMRIKCFQCLWYKIEVVDQSVSSDHQLSSNFSQILLWTLVHQADGEWMNRNKDSAELLLSVPVQHRGPSFPDSLLVDSLLVSEVWTHQQLL